MDTTTSTGSCRRSARFNAELRNATMEVDADVIRSESMPELTAGKLIAAISPIRATTMIISIRVTPRVAQACDLGSTGCNPGLLRLPAEYVGIHPFAAGRSIGSVRNDVRLIPVLAGILIDIRPCPWVIRYVGRKIRPVPLC